MNLTRAFEHSFTSEVILQHTLKLMLERLVADWNAANGKEMVAMVDQNLKRIVAVGNATNDKEWRWTMVEKIPGRRSRLKCRQW